MARQIRKPRFPMTTKGGFGNIVPAFRCPVVPGETLRSMKCMLNLQSFPVVAPLAGAWFDIHFFYVPLRLVDATAPAGLTAGTYAPPAAITTPVIVRSHFGDAAGGFVSKLAVDAYDLVVNNYFRVPEIDGVWATTVGVPVAPAPSTDWTAEMYAMTTTSTVDVLLDLSGVSPNQKVSLDALNEAEKQLAAARMRDNMDGTYKDYLAAFGVSTDNSDFPIAPEFLTSARKWVMPSKAVDQTTGETVQSYFLSLEHNLSKRKYFSEHGFIIGVMMMRPKFFLKGKRGQFDDQFPTAWKNGYQVDPLAIDPAYDLAATDWASLGAVSMDARAVLFRGEQLLGNGVNADDADSMVLVKDPATLFDARYVYNLAASADPVGHPWAYQVDALFSLDLATGVSRPRLY